MTIFVAVILAVLTFAFVAYPFFRQRLRSEGLTEDEKMQELHSRRDTTYSMLKELEFDFQSGILTEDDYQDLEARYKRKAISILRDIDNQEKAPIVEEEIEKQVRELRQSKSQFCPQCGAQCQEDNHFCSRCGTSLSQGEHVD